MPKIRSVGLLAEAGEVVTHEWTERITDHYYGYLVGIYQQLFL